VTAKKHVFGSEAMIAGMGCQTLAFGVLGFSIFLVFFCVSAKQKFLSNQHFLFIGVFCLAHNV